MFCPGSSGKKELINLENHLFPKGLPVKKALNTFSSKQLKLVKLIEYKNNIEIISYLNFKHST